MQWFMEVFQLSLVICPVSPGHPKRKGRWLPSPGMFTTPAVVVLERGIWKKNKTQAMVGWRSVQFLESWLKNITPPKINMEPGNDGFQ